MTYRTYIQDLHRPNLGKVRVFPRSRKTSVFKTIAAAENRLQRLSHQFTHDGRGLVYDADGALVLTIAL